MTTREIERKGEKMRKKNTERVIGQDKLTILTILQLPKLRKNGRIFHLFHKISNKKSYTYLHINKKNDKLRKSLIL